MVDLEIILDLHKIARSQSKSDQAKTGLSEGGVPVGTTTEENQFAVRQIWSGGGGALGKSSLANWGILSGSKKD